MADSDDEESDSDSNDEFAAYPKLIPRDSRDSDDSTVDDSEVEDDDDDHISFQINADYNQDNLEYENNMDEEESMDITAAANNPKVIDAMKKLDASYNPIASNILRTRGYVNP